MLWSQKIVLEPENMYLNKVAGGSNLFAGRVSSKLSIRLSAPNREELSFQRLPRLFLVKFRGFLRSFSASQAMSCTKAGSTSQRNDASLGSDAPSLVTN